MDIKIKSVLSNPSFYFQWIKFFFSKTWNPPRRSHEYSTILSLQSRTANTLNGKSVSHVFKIIFKEFLVFGNKISNLLPPSWSVSPFLLPMWWSTLHLSLLCALGQPSKFIDNYIYYGDEMFHNLLILRFDPKNSLDGYTWTSCVPHQLCSTQNSISPMMNSIPPMMN